MKTLEKLSYIIFLSFLFLFSGERSFSFIWHFQQQKNMDKMI